MPEHHLGEIYEHRNPPPIEGKGSGLWCHHLSSYHKKHLIGGIGNVCLVLKDTLELFVAFWPSTIYYLLSTMPPTSICTSSLAGSSEVSLYNSVIGKMIQSLHF